MKILFSLICLFGTALSGAEEVHHVGTNVSTDPVIRVQAIKYGDQPYRCTIYPDMAFAFKDEDIEQIEIVVSFQTADSGYMSTSRSFSRQMEKLEMILVEFTETSMEKIFVEVRYSNIRRMWGGTKQNLGELCKGRDLPFVF